MRQDPRMYRPRGEVGREVWVNWQGASDTHHGKLGHNPRPELMLPSCPEALGSDEKVIAGHGKSEVT